jgi:CheY-like chemotaxis protein
MQLIDKFLVTAQRSFRLNTKDNCSMIQIFVGYAREDEAIWVELRKHLEIFKRTGSFEIWCELDMQLGAFWKEEREKHLLAADVILLLLSSDYLHADYYHMELKRSLHQQKLRQATLIPILVRPVDWQETPLASVSYLPRSGEALVLHSNQDLVLQEIVREIWRVVESLKGSEKQKDLLSLSPESETLKHIAFPLLPIPLQEKCKLVMVIDDSYTVCTLCECALLKEGFEVTLHANSMSALQWLTSSPGRIPDLILLDSSLSLRDAYALARFLKSQKSFKKIIIVMFTAHHRMAHRIKGYLLGTRDYLIKPSFPCQVVSCVRAHLGAPHAELWSQ